MPSGIFRAQSIAGESYQELIPADFDGDRRDDLLSVSNAGLSAVLFFDAAGAVARSTALPVSRTAAVGDITADGLPDVLLAGADATAFRATQSRSFSPLIGALRKVAPPAKLLTLDLDCDGNKDFALLGGDGARSARALSSVLPTGELSFLGLVDTSARDLEDQETTLGNEPTDARYRYELTSSAAYESSDGRRCGMLALPGSGRTVDVWAAPDGQLRKLSQVSYPLTGDSPEAASALSRIFFSDLNGDGRTDLLISSPYDQWASYGLGDGTFGSDSQPTAPGDSRASFIGTGTEVLAVGELDAQPGLDLFPWDYDPNTQFYWAARALDLNADGRLDVAAVGEARRVDLFRGHSSGLISRLSVPLSGIPRIEDTGDFDGDGAPDLLLSQSAALTRPLQTATILFAPVDNDASATDLVSFDRIHQLVAANLPEWFAPPDASTDIAALFDNEAHGLRLGFLTGGTDRLLRSPLPKGPLEAGMVDWSSPAIGRFTPDGNRRMVLLTAILSLAEDALQIEVAPSLRIDLLSSDSGGVVVASSSRSTVGGDFDVFARPAAVDLDGDGLDEVYVPSERGLLRVTFANGRAEAEVLFTSEWFSTVRVADVNADGALDLLVTSSASGARVAFGGGDGLPTFDATLVLGAVDWLAGSSVALLNVDADPALELAVSQVRSPDRDKVVGGWLRVYDVDWSDGTASLLREISQQDTLSLASGDFNGDGVDDLIGSYDEMTLWLGVPR